MHEISRNISETSRMLRLVWIVCAFFAIFCHTVFATADKNNLETDLSPLRNRRKEVQQSENKIMLANKVTESVGCRDSLCFSSIGRWPSSFLPNIQDSWSRRGKVLGLIGIISTAVYYRLRQTGWKNPFYTPSIFRPLTSNSASQQNQDSEGQLTAIGATEDLRRLEAELSEKDRSAIRIAARPPAARTSAVAGLDGADASTPFNADYFFSILQSEALGRILLYSPTLVSTQTTLFSSLDTERSGLVCLADRRRPSAPPHQPPAPPRAHLKPLRHPQARPSRRPTRAARGAQADRGAGAGW